MSSFFSRKEPNKALWSVEFDGKSILVLLYIKPKMSFEDIKCIIVNEGGSVDSNGIIHKRVK